MAGRMAAAGKCFYMTTGLSDSPLKNKDFSYATQGVLMTENSQRPVLKFAT
jgi:hypothetical protein